MIDIALDPVCFVDIEKEWPGWENLPFSDAYAEPETLWADWCSVRILANRYVNKLGTELNRQHSTAYGNAYWRELTLLWLLLLSQAARVREIVLTKLIDEHNDTPLTIEVPVNVEWAFFDDLDFMNRGIRNPDFDAWICGRLLRRRLPPKWKIIEKPIGPASMPRNPPAPHFPKYLSRLDSIPGMGWPAHLGSALLHLKPPGHYRPLLSEALSADVNDDSFSTDFYATLDTLVQETMPQILTSRFTAFDSGGRKYRFRAGKKIVTAATKYRPENRFILAHAKQAGEQVFRVQHGAGYGMARTMMAQEIEYFDSGFISWGWRRDGVLPQDAIPLPSPLLSRLRRWSPRNPDIALISTNIELSPHPFKGGPQASQWLIYRDWKVEFLNALPAAAREKVIYRPRLGARNDLEDTGFLMAKVGGLRILDGDFHAKIRRCRIAVIDHPGTAMHVLMVMGIPTVMFWQRVAWTQHPEAEKAFDLLRTCKILFHDPAEAAAHVASVHDDPLSWWDQDSVKAARRFWNANFAMTDRAWRRKWFAWLLQ